MVRTQVQLSEEQLRVLKARAAKENVSVSELVRQAVDAWTQPAHGQRTNELRRRAVDAAGRFASGRSDVAKRHDEYLDEAYGS